MEAMTKKSAPKIPDYGNWVATRFIYIPGLISLVFLGLAIFKPVLLILAGFFVLTAVYFAYARYLFSHQGGNVQAQIYALLFDNLDWSGDGQVLDIGCGNAAVTIQLVKKYPGASTIGIDYWGAGWEYSKRVCEENARLEGVGQRVSFQKASASSLPFSDEYFDAAVSNLVFHEVADTADKRDVIREALRVVKKGGRFAFQDLFLLEKLYGKPDDLLKTIRSWGIDQVEFIATRDAAFIPAAVKLPFMVGTLGMLVGVK
jgi:SAM-dependent methyltransferase